MNLAEHGVRLRAWIAHQKQDKLSLWRFAVPRLREAFGMFAGPNPIRELHLRGPNKGTKTESEAAYVIACAQKRQSLDGCPIPQWHGPVECVQLVLDYPQQHLSVQAAYLRLIAGWPHRARMDGETLKTLRVQPVGGSSEERDWSVINFLSQKNLTSGKGVRADVVAFDEPPVMEILQELRKAAHAGRPGIRIIAETPTKRREWAPLREDYGDSPRRSIRRVDHIRAECRWSLDEVADWVLSPAEKRELRESYRGDPLFGEDGGARWHGDYTNTEGKCPFDVDVLMEMLSSCKSPELSTWRVSREGEEGESKTVERVQVQVWKHPEPGRPYYLDVDPASGVADGAHNPAAIHVSEAGSGDLCARWNGYLAPYSLGVLAAGLARQFNECPVDVETNDHWGVNVVRGIQASRYGNLAYEQRELRPGEWAREAGFKMDAEARAVIIGQIQEWLASWKAGVRYAKCPSREVLECLLDSELDDRGKIVAGPGIAHGEDMILWGQKLRRAVSRSNREIPELQEPEKHPDELLLAKMRQSVEREDAPLPVPKLRSRR